MHNPGSPLKFPCVIGIIKKTENVSSHNFLIFHFLKCINHFLIILFILLTWIFLISWISHIFDNLFNPLSINCTPPILFQFSIALYNCTHIHIIFKFHRISQCSFCDTILVGILMCLSIRLTELTWISWCMFAKRCKALLKLIEINIAAVHVILLITANIFIEYSIFHN